MRAVSQSIAKWGSTPNENEDAAAWSATEGVLRACIADGATESAFSREWARALSRSFCSDGRFDSAWLEWERKAARRSADLPWYVEAKVAQGAHAAALGIVVDGRSWHAWATGDCALFIVDSDGTMASAWPFESADAFGSTPDLFVSTRSSAPLHEQSSRLKRGHRLLLTTDAVAAHVLGNSADLSSLIDALDSEANFARWTDAARADGMRNDDTTALLITL